MRTRLTNLELNPMMLSIKSVKRIHDLNVVVIVIVIVIVVIIIFVGGGSGGLRKFQELPDASSRLNQSVFC